MLKLIFTGALAYGVAHMNGAGGLQAWRWLFIIEGLPCLVLAAAIFFFLPSYPERAKWLTAEDKAILKASFGNNVARGCSTNLPITTATQANPILSTVKTSSTGLMQRQLSKIFASGFTMSFIFLSE